MFFLRYLLTPIYALFTEGFSSFDLKQAKTLLYRLRADNGFRNGLLVPPVPTRR